MNISDIHEYTQHGGVRSLLKRAIECGIRVSALPGATRLTRFDYADKIFFLKGANAPVMRRMGNFTRDKNLTKTLLEAIGVRTPRGIVASSVKDALELIKTQELSFPLILKPTHGSRALGVTWDIRSEKNLREAFAHFQVISKKNDFKKITFLVEEMFIGNEYRVLVLNDKVISCVEKVPATVIGDGESSTQALIDAFNKTRLLGFKIRVDAIVKNTLKAKGLTLKSILPHNYVLRLRNNLNMSDGGRSIDRTAAIHQSFKDLCVKATEITGLTFAGVDVIAKDISTSAKQGSYVILELNPNPYYNMNEKPLVEGKGVDVSLLLLKNIFPSLKKN